MVKDGIEQKGAVTLLISGNRPINEILNDEPKLVRIDGRPDDLNKNIPVVGLHTWSLSRGGQQDTSIIEVEDAFDAVEKAISLVKKSKGK